MGEETGGEIRTSTAFRDLAGGSKRQQRPDQRGGRKKKKTTRGFCFFVVYNQEPNRKKGGRKRQATAVMWKMGKEETRTQYLGPCNEKKKFGVDERPRKKKKKSALHQG